MNKIIHLGKMWLVLSVTSFLLYWLLWFIIDQKTFDSDGYSFKVVAFDFLYCAVYSLCTMGISFSIYHLFYRTLHRCIFFITASVMILLANILLSFLFEQFVNNQIFYNTNKLILIEGIYIYSLVASFLSMLTLLWMHYKLLAEEQRKNQQLEMRIIKLQLNPHFIFNSLSTLEGLIDDEPTMAHEFVIKLSQVYRYIVKHFTDETVIIGESINFTRNYCSLLEIRYPGHFKISIDNQLDNNPNLILPLSLQLLTENAVKHNKHSMTAPLEIQYTLETDYLVVKNSYNPNKTDEKSLHMGLQSLQNGYEFHCGKSCIIHKTENYFEVKIPIIKMKKQ